MKLNIRYMSTLLYLTTSYAVLFIVREFSDLPISIGNASQKAEDLLNLNLPTNNFYPIGKAILLIPFVWNKPNYFLAILFYFSVGIYYYLKICDFIENSRLRLFALLALPLNPYLIWLIYSSQDTVFEFALLMLFVRSLIKKKYLISTISGYLLCLTRPAYWIAFIFMTLTVLFYRRKVKRRLAIIVSIITMLLAPATLIANYYQYGEADFAGESGMTAFFSYNKYLYLSLPLFDMDVFLSTEGHVKSESISSKEYSMKALSSIQKNPKQIILAELEKFDAYIFDIQKVPHLPGEYYLSEDASTIIIGNERLNWQIVVGNLVYAIYRTFILGLLISTLGAMLFKRVIGLKIESSRFYLVLILPWILGIIPGLLYYTETRFKIVPELLLAPFIAIFWSRVLYQNSSLVRSSG